MKLRTVHLIAIEHIEEVPDTCPDCEQSLQDRDALMLTEAQVVSVTATLETHEIDANAAEPYETGEYLKGEEFSYPLMWRCRNCYAALVEPSESYYKGNELPAEVIETILSLTRPTG